MSLPDNVVWRCLAGPHSEYACGSAEARRYRPGFSPIIAFGDASRPDFGALAPYCAPGERVYCSEWSGPAPADWRIEVDALMHQLVWNGAMPDTDERAGVRLGREHVPEMLQLVEATHPGPFGPRTHELGTYVGIFEEGRLVAMAGERMRAGSFREISGVCTLPEVRGRGFARRLVSRLIRRQIDRDETPFLHVIADNAEALRMYERMGFRHHATVAVRVVSRTAT